MEITLLVAIAALGIVWLVDRYHQNKDLIHTLKRIRALEDKVKLMDRR